MNEDDNVQFSTALITALILPLVTVASRGYNLIALYKSVYYYY